jgi:CRISPR/Cas system-associated endonuclease Cas1
LNKGEFLAHRNVHRSEDETANPEHRRNQLRRLFRTSDGRRASTIRPRRIRIVLEGLRGEDSIAELCRREGIAQKLYYRWSKDFFLEAGKKRLAGDTARGRRPTR